MLHGPAMNFCYYFTYGLEFLITAPPRFPPEEQISQMSGKM